MITTNSGKILSKDARDWKFNHPSVLKKVNDLFENVTDAVFVIFSNQLNLNSKVAERAAFESKIDSVISKMGLANKCPVICLFATSRDEFRKPCAGMWRILKEEFIAKNSCEILIDESFFVGDAAGRQASWKPGRSADWSSVDHKFAVNVGLKFYTPEEFFLNEEPVKCYDLGRNPKSITVKLSVEQVTSPIVEEHFSGNDSAIMVMAVGSPASGKSTFYRRHFEKRNFVHVNRDTLKTIPKCLSLVRSSLLNNQSVYIDNTHPTRESREAFISVAKELNIPIKCLQFTADEWLCKHLDVFRSITRKIEPLPAVAFNTFRAKYQPPTEGEGFDAIIQVPFDAYITTEDHLELFHSYLF